MICRDVLADPLVPMIQTDVNANSPLYTAIFAGHARLPGNIAAYQVYQILTIEIEVDLTTETVINADCTLIPELSRRMVTDHLIGHDMRHGPDTAIDQITQSSYTGAERSIATALRNLFGAYSRVQRQRRDDPENPGDADPTQES